jgi:hypothetical protein
LEKYGLHNLKEQQLNALVHAKHMPAGLSNKDYRYINSMNNVGDDLRAQRGLRELVNLGLLERTGIRRFTRYTLSKKV